jgi:hypothetical protein
LTPCLRWLKKTLPKKGVKPPTSPITLLKDAIKKKDQYKEVYDKAKQLIAEQYKDYPDIMKQAQDYLDSVMTKPYTPEMVQEAVDIYTSGGRRVNL